MIIQKAWSDEARAASAAARARGARRTARRETGYSDPKKPPLGHGRKLTGRLAAAESARRAGLTRAEAEEVYFGPRSSRESSMSGATYRQDAAKGVIQKVWSDEARAAAAEARRARESKPSTGPTGIPQREGRIRKPEKFPHRKPQSIYSRVGSTPESEELGSRGRRYGPGMRGRTSGATWRDQGKSVKKEVLGGLEAVSQNSGVQDVPGIQATGGVYPFKPRSTDSYGDRLIPPSAAEMISMKYDGMWEAAKVRTRGPVGSQDAQ